jgi:pilus assembly protein Flp/PilA
VNLTRESEKFLKEKSTMLTYAIVMVQNYLATLEQEEGQGMAEYGLILALISIAAIVVMGLLGTQISTILSQVKSSLGAP